jgi:ABC-type polysaccharide/polyol phosphate export permease
MNSFIKELYKYRFLIHELVIRDIKKKYRRSVLGVLWSILNPLLMMSVTAMVFSTLFRFSVGNYPLYLLIGQIMFTLFAESTNFAMSSIIENSSLIKKIYIPKYLFPLSRVISSVVNFLFTIPALAIIILATGQPVHWQMISFILPLLLFFFFCLGIGLLLASMAVYFRDLFHLYGVLLTLLNYATPIFYPENIVPPEYSWLLAYNPLYYFVKAFRASLYDGTFPDFLLLIQCAGFALLAMAIGVCVFKRKENHFILYV